MRKEVVVGIIAVLLIVIGLALFKPKPVLAPRVRAEFDALIESDPYHYAMARTTEEVRGDADQFVWPPGTDVYIMSIASEDQIILVAFDAQEDVFIPNSTPVYIRNDLDLRARFEFEGYIDLYKPRNRLELFFLLMTSGGFGGYDYYTTLVNKKTKAIVLARSTPRESMEESPEIQVDGQVIRTPEEFDALAQTYDFKYDLTQGRGKIHHKNARELLDNLRSYQTQASTEDKSNPFLFKYYVRGKGDQVIVYNVKQDRFEEYSDKQLTKDPLRVYTPALEDMPYVCWRECLGNMRDNEDGRLIISYRGLYQFDKKTPLYMDEDEYDC